MKNAFLAYAAAILVVGGLVTALTAPKHEDERQKAAEQQADAARAKQPPPEISAPAAEIAARVEQIRGLRFAEGAPKLEMAPPATIEQQLTTLDTQAESQAKGEDKQRDTTLKTAAGIVLAQAGALTSKDAEQASKQYSGAGALGVWVPQQNKVLVSRELGESDPERAELVYVHELARALEAERFGEAARRPRPFRDDEAAELALQEGTAMLTASTYAEQHLETGDTGQALAAEAGSEQELAPALAAYSAFGAEDGGRFVEQLHERGGWEAVNAAHDEMPVTTREILHPEAREEGDTPPPALSVQEAVGSGWQRQASSTIGELDTIAILRAGLEPQAAEEAADGWVAGQMEVWGKGPSAQQCPPPCRDKSTSVLVWRWSDAGDATEFTRAVRRSLEGAAQARPEGGRAWTFKDRGAAALVRAGRFTALTFAPTPPQAGKVAQAALNG